MKKIVFSALLLLASLAGKAQYKLDTISYAGPSRAFTDIVFLGDGFMESEMSTFVDFVYGQVDHLFQTSPWGCYKNRFNIFYVKTPSNESGVGMTPDKPKDTVYGVCFGTSGVDRMPWPTKWSDVYGVLNQTKPDYDIACVVANSLKYGGGGGGSFLCYSMESNSDEMLRHELGHAFANLMDEYWYRGEEAANMTQKASPVKWNRWLGYRSVGVYRYDDNPSQEGYSWYRPHQNCEMRYLRKDYCAVCNEAIIERIHETSMDIISYQPSEKTVSLAGDCLFSLNLLKPNPNTLRVDWMLDGQRIAHNVDQVNLKASSLTNGQHELMVTVEDTTLMVRTDSHTTLHASSLIWQIECDETGLSTPFVAENEFSVGPLPFSSSISFTRKQPNAQPVCMELCDMNGRVVARKTFKGEGVCTLSTPRANDGIYLLRVYQGRQLIYCRKVLRKGM